MRSERSSVAAPGTCATPGRRPSRRRHRHRSAPGLPPSARFQDPGQLARVQLRTPQMSSCLLHSLPGYEPRANAAMVQNLRDLTAQTCYPDAWVTSLAACFFNNIQCLIPDGRPTLHRSKPISLRSTPKANQWIHVLLPALLAALRTLGDAPARSLTALAQRLGVVEADAAAGVAPLEEVPVPVAPLPAAAPTSPLLPMTGPNGAASAPKTLRNRRTVIAARKKTTRRKMSC